MILYRCSEEAAVGAGAGAEERHLPVQREQPDPTRLGSTTAGRQSGIQPTGTRPVKAGRVRREVEK
jgi:hypothetical protein